MNMTVKFEVHPGRLATAMVECVVEAAGEAVSWSAFDQDEDLVAIVESMTKAQAMAALKNSFTWYGTTGGPDLPRCAGAARVAAVSKAHRWLGTTPSPAPQMVSIFDI